MYEWYAQLNKPLLSPPAYIFPIVWTILYTMMALSLYVFLSNGMTKGKVSGLVAFFMQLILNLLWSPVFFGLHSIKYAFVIVVFMVVFTIITIYEFYKYSKFAAVLLMPYLFWILFATYLNFEFMRLN